MRSFSRLALPLILLLIAALACSITVSETRIQNARLFTDTERTNGTRSFERDQTFFARADLDRVSEGATILVVWRAVDVGADHAAYEIAREELETLSGPLAFELAPPAEGWPAGNYVLEYHLNGSKKLSLDFTVKGKRK